MDVGCSYDHYDEPTKEEKWMKANGFTYHRDFSSYCNFCGVLIVGGPYNNGYLKLHITKSCTVRTGEARHEK